MACRWPTRSWCPRTSIRWPTSPPSWSGRRGAEMAFSADVLKIDLAAEAERICGEIRRIVSHELKRRGVVVALSGGIDSSCVAALAVKALGPAHVHGLHMPERDSSDDTIQ